MKARELRQKTEKELHALLKELREKLRSLRFDLAAGKVKNVRLIKENKKTIARILTILKERQLKKSVDKSEKNN